MTARLIAFCVLIMALMGFLSHRNSRLEVKPMTNWVVLKDKVKIAAKPTGLWTLAAEWVEGPALLKFEAGDEAWFYSESDSGKTYADGHLASLLATKTCLLPSAPVGALIGKIGGSSASATDGTLFAVGKFTLLEIDKPKGPLYLTINDELTGFGNNRGEILVNISSRPAPAASASAPPKPASDKPTL